MIHPNIKYSLVVLSALALLACGKEPAPAGKSAMPTPPVPIALQSPRTAPLASGEADSISQVDVLFFTYLRSNPGTVTLRVQDEQGNTLREATAKGESLKDGAYHTFRLDPPLQKVRGKNLNIEVSFNAKGKESMVAVQGQADSTNRGFTHRVK